VSEVQVRDVPDAERFEAVRDDRVVGFVTYRVRPGTDGAPTSYALLHTEVDPDAGGGGVGSALVRGALEWLRDNGFQVLPYCPFVRGWIERHDGFTDLVPEARRQQFGLAPTD
jgi:predicted GNAT family acetyltransferase